MANSRTHARTGRSSAPSTVTTADFPIRDEARVAEARVIARYTKGEDFDRDTPVKLPDDFGDAIRVVLPVDQATSAGNSSEDDSR